MDMEKSLQEILTAIVTTKKQPKTKVAELMSYIADRDRQMFYKFIGVEKSHGPAWVEKVKKVAHAQN